ncbi:MAG: ABC transporter ATP-binding protein/permease [Micrococcales bacterium]
MVALAIFSSGTTLLLAWQLSSAIVGVFLGGKSVTEVTGSLLVVLAAGLVKALVLWLQEAWSTKSSALAKSQLRSAFLNAVEQLGSTWLKTQKISTLNSLATSGLDSLDAYFAKFLPQLISTFLVTPIFTAVIFWLDPLSGIAVIATIPLIPIFMIFIGWATQTVQNQQLTALHQLTGHFLEVVRGLTTLRIFGRAKAQLETIGVVSEQYRVRTMKVLRISFLSGFALELAASLSVALVAVSIGLRLVNGEISLAVGLFVLLIAPEAYLPLRLVGANFHASSEGVAASSAVLDIISLPKEEKVHSDDKSEPAFAVGQVTAVYGRSGVGKTSMLNNLRATLGAHAVAWLPQNPSLIQGSVRDNIVGPDRGENYDSTALQVALRMAALDDVSPTAELGAYGSMLSGGQAQRVALARAFYRALATPSVTHVLLDEPISSLDEARAEIVAASLQKLAKRGLTVVAVSHQAIVGADQTREVRSEL